MISWKYTLEKLVTHTVCFDSDDLGEANPDSYALDLAQEFEDQRPGEILCDSIWEISYSEDDEV